MYPSILNKEFKINLFESFGGKNGLSSLDAVTENNYDEEAINFIEEIVIGYKEDLDL